MMYAMDLALLSTRQVTASELCAVYVQLRRAPITDNLLCNTESVELHKYNQP